MRAFIFFSFWLCFVAWLAGCQTPYTTGGLIPEAMAGYHGQQYAGRQMFYRPGMMMRVPPNVGYLHQPPMGWEAGERGITIFNPKTRAFRQNNRHARCWLDGKDIKWIVQGRLQRGYIVPDGGGVVPVPLLRPGQESYHILRSGEHHIRCEFYAGPPPFEMVAEGTATFDTRRMLEPRLSMEYVN